MASESDGLVPLETSRLDLTDLKGCVDRVNEGSRDWELFLQPTGN